MIVHVKTTEDFHSFANWIYGRNETEFDVETTYTVHWCERKLVTVQFGDVDNQWVMEWEKLTEYEKEYIKQLLEREQLLKIIHNAQFECVMMLFYGIRIRNVFDTMLAEQVLHGGDQMTVSYGLGDVCMRRLGVELDKSYQTSFKLGVPLSEGQIVYAAQDVSHLGILKNEIYQQAQQYGLEWTIALENEAVLAFSEMIYNGMTVDRSYWIALQDEVQPLVGNAQEQLNNWLRQPPFYQKALSLKYISEQDRLLLNLNSPVQKKELFADLFPHIYGTTKANLQRYRSDRIHDGQKYERWIDVYLEGDVSALQQWLLEKHYDYLVDKQWLIPAGVPTINWDSTAQVLPLIQMVEKVKDLSAESLGRTSHPIIDDYENFKDTIKLVNSFGEKWLQKNVESDGKVRTSFNQVLTTGRISSSSPNMQQIPAKENVGNRYRNAFLPPEGWSFVSSDYVSQELIVIAYLSKDPVWQDALSKGQDLHSIAAEMVFGQKWKQVAESDCAYYKNGAKEKCKCKKHKHMRNGVKTINFGLAYGMSEFKLAGTLRITVPEAKKLIEDYFRAFPGIKGLLTYLGAFGVTRGYIQTIWPFYRRRWFSYWKHYIRFIDSHLMGAQYHPGLGEIERASKNMPIQGTSADITKVALCLLYWKIHDEGKLEDKVTLAMQVHDQVDTYARNDFCDEWKTILTEKMEEAAAFIISTGILKADTTITERWSK